MKSSPVPDAKVHVYPTVVTAAQAPVNGGSLVVDDHLVNVYKYNHIAMDLETELVCFTEREREREREREICFTERDRERERLQIDIYIFT